MPELETATDALTGFTSLVRMAAIAVGAYIVYRLLTEGSEEAGDIRETIERNIEEQTPDIYDTGNEGVNAATEYATRETAMGPTLVGSIIGDAYPARKAQTGREQPVPNYQGPAIWGWERLSTPNYKEQTIDEEPTPVSGGTII